MKGRDQIKVQKAALTLSYTTAFIPINSINLQQQGQNKHQPDCFFSRNFQVFRG